MSDVPQKLKPHNDNIDITITGMASQLGINVAIAVAVLMVFAILRPNISCKLDR